MSYSFVSSTAAVQSVASVIIPAGVFQGSSFYIGALDDSNFANWGGTLGPKARIFPSNAAAGQSMVVTPGPEDGVILVYSFSSSDILNNLWQVPDGAGEPLVPIGTTFGTLNDVINACGTAGVIYFDSTGPKTTA